MAQRISTQEYEAQRNNYTKKALSELFGQMKAMPMKESDDGMQSDDEEDEFASGVVDKIINLAAKNAELKSRIDREERSNHYLKLELANSSCELANTTDKLRVANDKVKSVNSFKEKLYNIFIFCCVLSFMGIFTGNVKYFVYINNIVYMFLAGCVESFMHREPKHRPVLTASVAAVFALNRMLAQAYQ